MRDEVPSRPYVPYGALGPGERFDRLDKAVAQVISTQEAQGKDIVAIKAEVSKVSDHETRLRSLERWKYGIPIAGLLALAAALSRIH